LEDWQRLFIRRLFGWKRTEDGTRRYRKVYLSMGRKNGKTEMSAGIALALLVLDGEPGRKSTLLLLTANKPVSVFEWPAKWR
jgi:Phage terminase-like protein, large subunit